MKKCLVYLFFLLPIISVAHQPRIVTDNKEPVEINNINISQAFYGELKDTPQAFYFNNKNISDFYYQILVPNLPEISKDISVDLYVVNMDVFEKIDELKGDKYEWKQFYEEFARDSYFQGPENKIKLEAGNYAIRVYSPSNKGKYVLVVGEKESFPFDEIIKTIYTLPLLKSNFWNKNYLDGFLNIFGIGLSILVFIIIFTIYFIVKIYRKYKNK